VPCCQFDVLIVAQVEVVAARQSSPVYGVHAGQREDGTALLNCARLETGRRRRQLFSTARTLQPRHKADTRS